MNLTLEQTKQMLPGNTNVASWYTELVKYFDKYEINTINRIAGFMAQAAHESNNFNVIEENLYYGAKGLEKTFSKYFSKAGRNANDYAMNPEKIANVVYASRMGNGNTASGDGYKFRGRGIIQLTGKNNYATFGSSINKTADEVVDYLETIEGAVESACWFWNYRNINAAADSNNIIQMTKLVNGGTNGLTERTNNYNRNLKILQGSSISPVTSIKSTSSSNSRVILKRGSIGPKVAELQEKLQLKPDGIFGISTELHLKSWQIKHGLTPDGIAGPLTFKALSI